MTQTPSSAIRVAVAGIGFGSAVHVPALRSIPGVDIVAIAAASMERARRAADRLSIPCACDSIQALLDREVDAVTLALPPQPQDQALRTALGRPVAIFAEKPLSFTGMAATEIAQAAKSRITAVDFEFAELETFRELKRVLDGGTFGPVASVEIDWRTASRALREGLWSWKTDAHRGGGVLNLFATHSLYLIEWLLGPIASVMQVETDDHLTQRFAPTEARAAEETTAFSLRLVNGGIVKGILSNGYAGSPRHRWVFTGEQGRAILENTTRDYMNGFTLRLQNATGSSLREITEPVWDGDGRYPPVRRLMERFIAAVRDRKAMIPDFSSGARVQMLIDAMHRAGTHKAAVQISSVVMA